MRVPASCSLIDEAVSVAAGAARAGGGVLIGTEYAGLDVERTDVRVRKATSADRASHAAVVADLRTTFPDHLVVGEHGTVPGTDDEHVWYVDGLDGTANFANGLPWYCVSVALRCREHGGDEVVAGAVYDPVQDELYCAGRGRGATANGVAMRVSEVASLEKAVVVSQIKSSDPEAIAAFAATLETLLNAASSVRVPGAPALILSHVAAGNFTAYVESQSASWDVSAGQLILEEAGGTVTDLTGRPIAGAAATDVVATNTAIHQELLEALARVR